MRSVKEIRRCIQWIMKHEPTRADENLNALLQEWQVDRPLPAGFDRSVWRRIANQAGTTPVTPVTLLRDWITQLMARPAWGISYALLLLSAGLVTGYWQASAQTARWDQLMASRYVQSLDPYFQANTMP